MTSDFNSKPGSFKETVYPTTVGAAFFMLSSLCTATYTEFGSFKFSISLLFDDCPLPGPNGRESAGTVDLLAIRRDHRTTNRLIKRGDLLRSLSFRYQALQNVSEKRYYQAPTMSPMELIGLIASIIAIYEFLHKIVGHLFKRFSKKIVRVHRTFSQVYIDGFAGPGFRPRLFKKISFRTKTHIFGLRLHLSLYIKKIFFVFIRFISDQIRSALVRTPLFKEIFFRLGEAQISAERGIPVHKAWDLNELQACPSRFMLHTILQNLKIPMRVV